MKKLLVLFIVTIILSTTAYASNEVKYENYAEKLKEIGVFKGTSSGFELDREPTRIEAAVMFVRLLGAEQEALDKNYEHPFTDVPEWANAHVGYLYHERLTNGIGASAFGSTDFIQANSYFTFILRALGYDDSAGDFVWNQSLEFAKEQSLIMESDFDELNTTAFLRDHVAKYSYLALKMQLKEGDMTLVEKLIKMDAIDEEIIEVVLDDTTIVSTLIPITELTPELISKLQSYPYVYGKEPVYNFELMEISRSEALDVVDNFYIIKPIPLNSNQILLTNRQLTYITEVNYNFHYLLRGILQEKLQNGTITQYEVEYEYKEGKYNSQTESYDYELVKMRILSE